MNASLANFVFINNGRQSVAVDTIKLMKATDQKTPVDACVATDKYVQKQSDERKDWEVL
jgi:hypothetical protein